MHTHTFTFLHMFYNFNFNSNYYHKMEVLDIFKRMMFRIVILNTVGDSGQDSNMTIFALQIVKNETPKFRSGTPHDTPV